MATLSLKISIEGGKVVKTIQFEPSTTVYDACRIIREKILEASAGDPKEYGLFLASEEDNKKGIWLEASRSLDYYMLRNGDLLEYNKKTRNLRVRMLDGTVKTLLVDDSQIVANLMVVICTKIGITNYDEYGLVREEQKDECDPCEKPNYGTLTLKRRHQEKERDAKMEQLRKKLRTDDEVNWVEPSKTLREQGVEATETLLLRRKLFFSDRNVDSRDPVQLTLLYVQARDAIVDGTHPVTQDKACEFAGIQCQIQFGDHREDKHMPGFLDLKEFLPASYVKVKNIEKKVLKEHRRHATLSELDAKVLYTKSARELPTYGVAFFLVKEKMKGKNKLVPRLLGVTKDSVLRLDEKTKEILQSWPLTTVRRWCASPNTFTLDFGDYSDQYYSVQTTEAEQILQVIAGYIDIIVRKQRAKEHLGIDGDEGSAMLEDSVSPSKANIIQHDTFKSGKVNTESVAKPAVHRPGAEGAKPFAVGHITGAQQTTVSGQIITGHTPPAAGQSQHTQVTSLSTEPQRALLSTISTGTQLIKKAQEELVMAELPELGSDAASIKWKQVTLDSNKQVVTSQIAAMNAATAQVVTLTSGPQEAVDHTAVGAAITSITTNLPHVTRGVGLLAALLPANGDSLLSATKRLCTAFTDLLKAAEPDTDEPRQSLLNAASRVGEASTTVLHTIEDNEEDRETQDILLSLAKSVANTTAALVLKAKNVAAQCKNDQQLQNNIIAAATNCALATSQLVACAKVVAPTLQNPACREQLECAARQVAAGVRRLVDASAAAPDAPAHSGLAAAATRVSDELQRLLDHAQQARAPPTGVDVETVLTRSERVVLAPSPHEMVRHARLLGQATAVLITDIKTEAERQPSENQRKLLAAAKLLADATARMVEAARQCASEPQDPEKQAALRAAAEELRYIAADYATGTERVHDHVYKLQETALQAASSATQLITSAQNAAQYNTNKHAQESFSEECRSLHSVIPPMVEAAHAWTQHGGAAKQLDLVSASEAFLQRSGDIMMSARSCVPTVQDASAARHLADTTQQYADDCSSLRTSVSRVRSSSHGLELDAAAEILRSLEEDFRELEEAARACQLRPLPGQTEEWSMSAMSVSSRGLCSSAAQLVSAARGGAGQGRAAGELARHAREFSGAVRAAAASRPQGQDRVVSHGRHVVQSSLTLVETVQRYITSSEPLHAASLVQIANDISKGLESTMEAMPSQSELDEVLENINETLNILNMGDLPPSDRTYGALQSSLSTAAAELSACACAVPEAVDSRPALSAAAARYGDSFNNTMQAAMEMAHHTQDREAQTVMVSSMKSVTINSSKLLSTAKSISQDLSRPNGKNQLTAAVRAVTESINKLVDVCTEAGPGVKQCAAALRSVAALAPLLRPAADPLSDLTYYECLDHVVDHSKALSEGMSGMANAIKRSEQEQFGSSVTGVAAAVTGLVEVTAQAAYLVGASHPASSAGRAGLVDQAQFARAAAAIRAACTTLADPATDQHQVLSAATAVARHTSSLCNACRAASARSASPQDKRTFVTAAKDVANCTATLVKEIKALDKDYTEANRQRCAAATGPLQDAVRSLCQFADSPDFASVPAKISPEGRQQQEVILDCGRNIQSGSVSMLEAARALGAAPGERAQWQALATHSKHVSDTIKALVTNIREQAPGQRECAAACDTLAQQIRVLDRAELQAVSQQAAPPPNNTLEGYCSQVESCATEMLERVEPLRAAATGHAEHLGHAVSQLVSYAAPLVEAGVGCSRRLAASSAPGSVLAHTRTVLEASGSLVQAAAASAGNPRATSAHATVESTATTVRAGLSELREAARALAARAGAVGPLLDTLTRATNTLTEHRMSLVGSYDENDSFVDYQTRMVGTAKDIARLATDMTAKSATDPSKLLDVANELCQNYESLAHDSVGAVATTPQADTAARIRNCVVDVGEAVKSLVRAGADCRLAPAPHNQSEVGQAAKVVGEKVVSVLSALQSCSQGTQACIDAAANIANIISDLDTTILFASAGTLQSEVECEQFSDHRELILKTAKRLVEDTKALVGGAAGQQDQLAAAATAANDTITSLVQVVKGGALALGAHSPESQVVVLHAARDVAAALRDLAAATTAASGRHHHHPHMQRLKHAAKVMVTNVTSLLKTVKAVEDEHTRGLRALESTIEAISQEIEALSSPAAAAPCSPEELVRRTRHMTAATAGAVAAAHSHSQDTLTAAANQGRRTVLDLLHAVKGAAQECECSELRARTLAAGRAAGESFRAVLLAVLAAVPDPAQRQLLPERSRAVAATVADIIALAEQLKGSDWVDPSDPTVIAEHELLGAAASIDAAAKKLESLRPRKPIQETDENMNFDEMILEAAKSIIAATSALVRAASAAQRELIDQGKVARRPAMSSDDGQWSEGLVSAARLVAAAAHALVEAANALVCGHASEERLVSAARHVAATTAHLLVACKVKADPSSESTRRLQAAGGAVLRSTDGLVRAARDAITDHEERSLVLNRRMVGGIAQEIDARTEVLRIEKELEEARGRLTAIRQAKYKLKTADGGEDTDTDGADYARLKSPTSFINTTYSPNSTYSPHITQNTTNLSSHISQLNQTVGSPYSPTNQNAQTPTNHSASYANQTGLTNQSSNLSTNQMYDRNGSYSQNSMRDEKQYTVQSGSFSSFRPQDETPKQNYEGFTSRYETRLYDTPRPVNEYSKTERHDNQYYSKQEQMFNYEAPKSPLSPKFNARELKFDEPIYSSLKKPLDGLGQTFSEHQKSTEAIPGGTKHSEYSIKSESYQSFPKTEYSKIETREQVKSPFTSTPKIDRTEIKNSSTELVKAVTPDYDRIASPYGKEVHSYGGPNFMEETTTEVKEIPNGTQKITTTKIYSSSPVNITSTNTKYEPIKLEGIDELSKAFDNDSKYSTLDSRFNTLESKLSSDTSRSFMRPSDFQSSDYQTTTSVTKVKKPAELSKELDTLDKKFSKQTVTSETIERKSVMTSSHKSETSSTVTKKFGNF